MVESCYFIIEICLFDHTMHKKHFYNIVLMNYRDIKPKGDKNVLIALHRLSPCMGKCNNRSSTISWDHARIGRMEDITSLVP